MNSRETPIFKKSKELFGLNKAKDAIVSTGVGIVMEGYTDVIAAHEAGVTNCVATLGTALTVNHIRTLSGLAKKRIVYLFDGDEAGQKAIERALQFIDQSMTPEAGRYQVELCAVTLPDNLDPAEYLAAYGADEFRARVAEAVPLLEFGIERQLNRFDLSRPEGRSAALEAALEVLAPIKDSILAKEYACQLAGRLRIREEAALDALRQVKPKAAFGTQAASVPDASAVSVTTDGRVVSRPHTEVLGQTETLPDYTDSRLGFEREFLSTVACNPDTAAVYAALLGDISWRAPVHKVLAVYIADTLSAVPDTSCAALVSGAGSVSPLASAILLGGQMADSSDVQSTCTYLFEELTIGDMEERIARMRSRLGTLQRSGQEETPEADALFADITQLQKDLLQLKKAHKPLMNA